MLAFRLVTVLHEFLVMLIQCIIMSSYVFNSRKFELKSTGQIVCFNLVPGSFDQNSIIRLILANFLLKQFFNDY